MRKKKVFVTLSLLPMFSSCGSVSFSQYSYFSLNEDPFVKIEKEGYYKVGDYSSYTSNGREIDMGFSPIYQSGNVRFNMPSVGETSFLVVPIDFEDSMGAEGSIDHIRSSFIGASSCNQYVSVAQYYDLCSMGRLHLKPIVVPTYFRSTSYPKTTDLEKFTGSSAISALTRLYNEALDWYASLEGATPLEEISFNSQSGVKKVPLYFVYAAPYSGEKEGSSNRDSMFWAFTINSPAPISWSSIDMLHTSNNKVDAHTFIHETGHLLGLEDYYDSSSPDLYSRVAPMGRMDMMDCSLGDMNCFSKMLLGWETPFVPTKDCEITLHQSSGNNECILLAPNWNETLFDQYLLLEFYTPTGLNRVDATLRSDPSMRLFQKPGIKAYIVRSNLRLYNGNVPTNEYLNENNYSGQRLYMGRLNNSMTDPLIQMLNKHSNSATLGSYFIASDREEDVLYFQDGKSGTMHLSDALFYEGEGVGGESFKNLRLNGQELGCSFVVSSLSASYAKVKITFDKAN